MNLCPRCGVRLPDGALFCPSCGTRIVSEPSPEAVKVAWDVSRPALPDDLFRRPEEAPDAAEPGELAPEESVGPVTSHAGDDPTLVRPTTPLAAQVPPRYSPTPSERPPLYRTGTPDADLLPSERAYASAAPTAQFSAPAAAAPAAAPATRPARANFSGARGVMIILAVLVLAAIIGGVMWLSGGSSGAAPSASKSATAAGSSAKASGSTSRTASATQTTSPSATPADAFPPTGSTLCQGSATIAVNTTTSCEFATNVAAAIPAGSTGTFVVKATSPVTQKEYEMICVKGTYTVCTGGTNAMVFVK